MPKPVIQFNVARMFELAGPQGLPGDMRRLLLKHHGFSPDLTVVQMWRYRAAIPSAWMAAVLYALMREGHRVYDLMTKP